jgi:hypothetical protein
MPFQRLKAQADVSCAAIADCFTTRRTPAWRAASITAPLSREVRWIGRADKIDLLNAREGVRKLNGIAEVRHHRVHAFARERVPIGLPADHRLEGRTTR